MDPLSLQASTDEQPSPALQAQPLRKVPATGPTVGLAPNPGAAPPAPTATTTAPPLPTEYPSAPSTTGQPQNRLQLAQNAFDTFAKSTAPQYTADLREATQKAAGSGTIGSGGLRTTYGNLANQRALALDTQRDNLINAATTATIGDQQAERGLSIQDKNAETSRIGTTGNLALGQGQLDLAKKTADIEAQFKAGTMTLAQKDQALRELSQSQGNTLAQGQLQLAKDQLAQTGAQFGLSLAQQKELATLADKTQNRQLDISGAQGQNALLLELARIMGSKDTNLDPNFLASVAKALGLNTPNAAGSPSTPTAASSAGGGNAADSLPPELRDAVRRLGLLPQPEPVAGAGYQVPS